MAIAFALRLTAARFRSRRDITLFFRGAPNNHHQLMAELKVKEALTETFGQPAKSFPALWPLLRVDRIYYRNLNLIEADCLTSLHWRRLSDHCPLFAEFTV